jgi:hypothetical protein
MNCFIYKYKRIIDSLISLTALLYPEDGKMKSFFIGAATVIALFEFGEAIYSLIQKKKEGNQQLSEVTEENNY